MPPSRKQAVFLESQAAGGTGLALRALRLEGERALRAAPPGPQPARRMSVTRGTGALNTWHKCVFLERM